MTASDIQRPGVNIIPIHGKMPKIHASAFVAPGCTIIGDVEIGAGSSIWYNCVLRADVFTIRIGERTNVQDGSVLHCDPPRPGDEEGSPLVIGDDVLIGHMAMVHGCTIHDRGFVGLGAIAMNKAVIGSDAMLAAGAMLTEGKVMGARRHVRLQDLTEDMFRVIPATQDEEDVAYAFNQYHLISAPVVDDEGRLAGVITIDDAMAVLDEEHEEDILRLAGVSDESSLSDSVADTTKRRLPWLAVNLLTAILASLVIAQFEETLSKYVALAVLMPIVASMGGNAGTQSLTVAVRALATKDLTGSNVWRVIRREVVVGLLNGLVFALSMGVIGLLWFGSPQIGYVIAAAMVINLVMAGLAGTVIPVVMDKMGIDPALASGTFVTTVTDVVGFFAFLGLAGVVLL